MIRRFPLARLALVLLLATGDGWMLTHRDLLRLESIEPVLRALGIWAPIGFVLIYATATVRFFSGAVLTLAGGALFGPVWGTLWNLIGATLGATVAFLIARYLGSDWVARRAGERLARLIRGVEQEGWRFVAFVRLVPLFPFNLVNYAFGLTRIRLGEYVLASFLCMSPGALAYTYRGYAGREAASDQAGSIHEALLALALLAAIAFLSRIVRRLRRSRFINPATLKRRLESGEQLALMDVRTPEEFRGPLGHIAGASNIP